VAGRLHFATVTESVTPALFGRRIVLTFSNDFLISPVSDLNPPGSLDMDEWPDSLVHVPISPLPKFHGRLLFTIGARSSVSVVPSGSRAPRRPNRFSHFLVLVLSSNPLLELVSPTVSRHAGLRDSRGSGGFGRSGALQSEEFIPLRLRAEDIGSAQFFYAQLCADGFRAPSDMAQIAQYHEFAADQNSAEAQFDYGVCLSKGIGVEVDLVKAAKYFKLAADQNDARAQYRYGLCLAGGIGAIGW
jgi:hypothetical protein